MAKKKLSPKKIAKKPARRPQPASAKKTTAKAAKTKKPIARKKPVGRKKPTVAAKPSLKSAKKTAPKKPAKAPAAKSAPAKKSPAKSVSRGKQESARYGVDEVRPKGLGYRSAGQSGDTEGVSNVADADSESVEELLEEGQAYEAEIVSGVEDALDPDESEVTTHEVPEDDIPSEYGGEQ